jgi:transketolase
MMNYQDFYSTDLENVQKISLDEDSKYLRKLILRAIINGGRGHIGPALSMVETIRVLYQNILKTDPKNPKWEDRDRYILSKGHGCLAFYAVLAAQKFFDERELDKFCHFNSLLSGHPEIKTTGVEASTGALGHGMPIGVGMALAIKNKRKSNQVFVHVGDGEINEGSVWEAAACADKHKLGNFNVIVDYNKLQSAGPVENIQPMEPLKLKWESFGFNVLECNGHDVHQLKSILRNMYDADDKPQLLIAHTIKGKGIKEAENNPSWHHKSKLSDEDLMSVTRALG